MPHLVFRTDLSNQCPGHGPSRVFQLTSYYYLFFQSLLYKFSVLKWLPIASPVRSSSWFPTLNLAWTTNISLTSSQNSLFNIFQPLALNNRLRLQVGLHMLVPRARTALLQRRALAVNGPSNWNCLHTLLRAKLVSGIFLTSSSSFKAFLYPRGSRADMKREHFHNCAKATQFLHPGNQGRRYFVAPDSL